MRAKLNSINAPVIMSLIVAFGIIAFVVVLLTYFNNFSGVLSEDQSVWGSFGDFVGGVLNPIFSFLALMALILALILQTKELKLTNEQLEKSAEANINQSKYYAIQQKRDEYSKLINILVDRIRKSTDCKKLAGEYSIAMVIHASGRENEIPFQRVRKEYGAKDFETVLLIDGIVEDVEWLRRCLDEYEIISKEISDSTPVKKFYKKEFEQLVDFLYRMEFVDASLFEYYKDVFMVGGVKSLSDSQV